MGAYVIRNLTTLGDEKPDTLIQFIDKSVNTYPIFLRCIANTKYRTLCKNCYFYNTQYCHLIRCSYSTRTDKLNVIYSVVFDNIVKEEIKSLSIGGTMQQITEVAEKLNEMYAEVSRPKEHSDSEDMITILKDIHRTLKEICNNQKLIFEYLKLNLEKYGNV
ncbi:MAG: hypothetical protein HDQ88_04890 [Clostridia bacterium]|nr:hypothetical protein [Clostridia bacterium]